MKNASELLSPPPLVLSVMRERAALAVACLNVSPHVRQKNSAALRALQEAVETQLVAAWVEGYQTRVTLTKPVDADP